MKMLIFVLNKTEMLNAVLAELAQRDICGATVLESMGMAGLLNGQYDAEEIPFLGSVRAFLKPGRVKSNVIFAVLEEERLQEAIDVIESVVGDLSKKNIGAVFSVPVDCWKGICGIGK